MDLYEDRELQVNSAEGTVMFQNEENTVVRLGFADRQAAYVEFIRDDPILSKLVLLRSTIGDLKANLRDPLLPVKIYLITFGRYLRALAVDIDMSNVLAATLGEMMGPHVDAGTYSDQEIANERIRGAVKSLLPSARLAEVATIDMAHFRQYRTQHPFPADQGIIGENWPDAAGSEALTDNQLMYYLGYLASVAGDFSANLYLSVIVHSHVGFIKHGNVTQAFIRKIREGIVADLGVDITLNGTAMKVFHRRYCTNINENNAPVLLKYWLQLVPAVALRLRLTIEQAAGSGLTAYISIGRAIRAFPDFPWPKVSLILKNDMAAFKRAVELVGDNSYYGFKRDLGEARSTNFKSLAWVAKELLIRAQGEVGLKAYRGWIKAPQSQETLLALIDDYITERTRQDEEPTDQDRADFTEISDMVAQNEHIFEV